MAQVKTITINAGQSNQRELPILKSSWFYWNVEGQYSGEVIVWLPPEIQYADLNGAPEIWSGIQAVQGRTLKRQDRVLCESYDGSWTASAKVIEAAHNYVKFGPFKREEMSALGDPDNPNYVEWRPGNTAQRAGYFVFDRMNRIRAIAGPFNSQTAAMAATPKPAQMKVA